MRLRTQSPSMDLLWRTSVVRMKKSAPAARPAARLAALVPAVALALSLAACGGPARPSSDEVAEGIQKVFAGTSQEQAMTDEAASCLADALVDSELSDETLTYIANGEDKQKDEADKALTTQIITDNLNECVAP